MQNGLRYVIVELSWIQQSSDNLFRSRLPLKYRFCQFWNQNVQFLSGSCLFFYLSAFISRQSIAWKYSGSGQPQNVFRLYVLDDLKWCCYCSFCLSASKAFKNFRNATSTRVTQNRWWRKTKTQFEVKQKILAITIVPKSTPLQQIVFKPSRYFWRAGTLPVA